MAMFKWSRKAGSGNAYTEQSGSTIADPDVGAREALYRGGLGALLSLLKEAIRAVRAQPDQQEKEIKRVDALQGQVDAMPAAELAEVKKLESQLRKDGEHLRQYLGRQRVASESRERELANVVSLLSRSVAEATHHNANFFRDIRAEGERIAEASRIDDLYKLKSVLQVASQKLAALVDNKESHDQSRIDALSNQVEELKTELREARATAQVDGLTGSLNRRSFDDQITDLVNRYAGTRKSFSLVMFDIDDFKRINDGYGHQVGDRVLIAFAQRCQSLLRPEDQLARYGGEEFAVILDRVSLRNAMKRARGICEAVAGARYAIEKGDNARQLAVTVSAGVAELRRGDSVDSVIKRADDALYLAKSQGKNRALSERDLDV